MLVQGREALAFAVNVSVDCSDVHGAAAEAGAETQVLPVLDTIYGNMAQVVSVVDTALATALTSGTNSHLRSVIAAATLTINLADCTGADDARCAGMARYVALFCPPLLPLAWKYVRGPRLRP
jgi:type IV secretory pathway VirB2 component (pilin)